MATQIATELVEPLRELTGVIVGLVREGGFAKDIANFVKSELKGIRDFISATRAEVDLLDATIRKFKAIGTLDRKAFDQAVVDQTTAAQRIESSGGQVKVFGDRLADTSRLTDSQRDLLRQQQAEKSRQIENDYIDSLRETGVQLGKTAQAEDARARSADQANERLKQYLKNTQDLAAADRAAAKAKREVEQASDAFGKGLQSLRLELADPLQRAQAEYNLALEEFSELAAKGKVSAESLAEAQSLVEEKLRRTKEAFADQFASIVAQLDGPMAEAQLAYQRRVEEI